MNDIATRPAHEKRGWRHASKRRAFLTHLAISAMVVGTVCALIFLVWYPAPYFAAKGAWNVLRVLVSVDLILGPLLTLILFRPGKPGLGLDMAMIAMIQLTALLYGTSVIYQERPYYAVFAVDRFEILARKDVDPNAVAGTEFAAKPSIGPVLAVASLPSDPVEFQRLIEETIFEGKPDIERRPERWSNYAQAKATVFARAESLSALAAKRPSQAPQIERRSRALGRPLDELLYVPLIGTDRALTLIIDPDSALPLDVLDIDPWMEEVADSAPAN